MSCICATPSFGPHGMIWVADYIIADYVTGEKYEVVRAVNEFTAKASCDWAFLVLEHTMFCTVVLRKAALSQRSFFVVRGECARHDAEERKRADFYFKYTRTSFVVIAG